MTHQKIKGNLIMLLTAFVWGLGFVAQSAGMEYIGANTFNGIRMLIGSAVLFPLAVISFRKKHYSKEEGKAVLKTLFKSGILCGVLLCGASTIQTYGLAYTTAGKSGFITAMYIIFVPIIGIFMKNRITVRTILCAFIALFGMYLLCLSGSGGAINVGDALTLVCAIIFSFHILVVDKYTPYVNAVQFSCIQFFVCGAINILLMLCLEDFSFEVIKSCTIPLLYSGLFACGIGYTLQPVGQRYAEPTTASILMSLESVFALLSGMVILKDRPTISELLGCLIMFGAIILIQLPDNIFKRGANK